MWRVIVLVMVLASVVRGATATEVVIVSTQHFISDMPEGYTPGHLRALLAKIKPDVLAVEACANVPDPWATAPLELVMITRPWASEQGVEIVPAGWNDPEYAQQIGTMFEEIRPVGKGEQAEQIERELQTKFAAVSGCAQMNAAATLELWRGYYAKLHEMLGKETPWEAWNARIADNVLAICRKHGGKRVAVVFGGAHAYYLTDRLSAEKDIRLIAAESFFPLDDAEVRRHTKDRDYVQALRLLNFMPGQVVPQRLAELRKILAKVETIDGLGNDWRYYSAKLLMHEGKPDEAIAILEELAKVKPDVLLQFDQTTPVCEAARLQMEQARLQNGAAR